MEHTKLNIFNRILVVKTHALGDVLMTTPALNALRNACPDAQIDFLTGTWSAPVLETNSKIDQLISFDDKILHTKKLLKLWALMRQLKRNCYDLAVIFQPSLMIQRLIRLAGIQQMAAPTTRWPARHLTYAAPWRQNRDRYVAQDFADVVRAMNIPVDTIALDYTPSDAARQEADRLLKEHLQDAPFLLVFPGGGRNPRDYVKQKTWPMENYYQLLKRTVEKDIHVILAGNSHDSIITRQLEMDKRIINLAGQTTLPTIAAIIERARAVLTNDSVPMHLALAMNRPFAAVFGPSRRSALLPENGNFIAIEADFPCAPCYDNQPFPQCDRMDCIRAVEIDRVWDAVMSLWQSGM